MLRSGLILYYIDHIDDQYLQRLCYYGISFTFKKKEKKSNNPNNSSKLCNILSKAMDDDCAKMATLECSRLQTFVQYYNIEATERDNNNIVYSCCERNRNIINNYNNNCTSI